AADLPAQLSHSCALRECPQNSGSNRAWVSQAKIAYQNGALGGTLTGQRTDCRGVTDATVVPTGYAVIAKRIEGRRMVLAAIGWQFFLSECLPSDFVQGPAPRGRIKSDTPLSRFTTLTASSA